MNQNYASELEFAVAVSKKAGVVMRKYFDGEQQARMKQDGTPVTIADERINSMVINELIRLFPQDGLIGEEESTAKYGNGRRWFCDPIDGTKAYTWGVPTSMFSLGLVVDGIPCLGVVYDPFLKRMYWAVKGQGSYCNAQPIRVSNVKLKDGVVAVTSSVSKISDGLAYVKWLSDRGIPLATFSGAVYKSMLVAKGRLAAYADLLVNAHDMAAVHVIIEEAGGVITSIDGEKLDYSRPFKGAIVSNGIEHQIMVQSLASVNS